MKFIVDAQLPVRLAHWLRQRGHDAVHTKELADGNRTADSTIAQLADRESRVVITKDADFVESFLLRGMPAKLLLISTGNIANQDLEALIARNEAAILTELVTNAFLELDRKTLTVRG
jgi:predicted nuclease of predicted toxin-antitoxin system